MPWLRIDDGFAENFKMQACGERARWMHVVALCYCSRNLTDGLLDGRAVKIVAAIVDRPCKTAVRELVAAGLWIDEGDGSYRINDFLEWNPDAETVKRLRKQRQEAGSLGGLAKREANAKASATANAVADVCTPPHPNPSQETSNPLGMMTMEEGFKRLVVATGARSKHDHDKLARTIGANRCTVGAVKLAIDACAGVGVRDPMAVALSTLKKRRAA